MHIVQFLNTIEDGLIWRTVLRMLIASVCGGVIGMERSYKGHSAGFRTHILICLGASITTLTSQYLVTDLHYYTDIARLGAQVIAGIGFIGAGTIIVSRSKKIHGLTTAAGMWTTAVIGLASGAGFYLGCVTATLLVLIAELLLPKLEHGSHTIYKEKNFCLEYTKKSTLDNLMEYIRSHNIQVLDLEIFRSVEDKHNMILYMTVHLPKGMDPMKIHHYLTTLEGVIRIETVA
ncbi:MAG: MgtC/SapB family protein [Firmicutes bacterium]|nr:MgtC/SapB family protein [Bacillota bacterium]